MMVVRKSLIVGLKSTKWLINEKNFIIKNKPWGVILFSRNIKSIQLLINECNGIIGPMINKEGSEWVNFESKNKKEYQKYIKKGIWDVDTIYGITIIKNDLIPFSVSSLYVDSEKYSHDDWDILMCDNLNKQGYQVQISNTNYYGGII
mgnify:CR=1 FL=1